MTTTVNDGKAAAASRRRMRLWWQFIESDEAKVISDFFGEEMRRAFDEYCKLYGK